MEIFTIDTTIYAFLSINDQNAGSSLFYRWNSNLKLFDLISSLNPMTAVGMGPVSALNVDGTVGGFIIGITSLGVLVSWVPWDF